MASKRSTRETGTAGDRAARTPLHDAVVDGDIVQVQQLLSSGADVCARDASGWTPLHLAAQDNAVEIAEILMNAGAAVDAQDSHGNAPLWRAVFNFQGNGRMISALRERGADPHRSNSSGRSPLQLARSIANYDVRQYFSDMPD